MKYVVPIIASLFIFIATFIVVGFILGFIVPESWWRTWFTIGSFSANLPSFIAFILASLAATQTFRASFRSQTGKLYKKKKR